MTSNLKSFCTNKPRIKKEPRKEQFYKTVLLDKIENGQKPLT